ncbi:GNAT family N-acetyltransferase [Gynuella sp.]|uniref:GNAT family N-acetyltransferase n=1 Tax=Gynuella sp. TaxID=2969146 RepID=UPI003D097EBA
MTDRTDILTERLIIKPAHRDMAEAVLKLHLENRHHFRLGSPASVLDRSDLEFWYKKLQLEEKKWNDETEYGLYGYHKETQQLICQIQISGIIRGVFQAALIGYKIDQQYEGQGLMREAMEAALKFAFDTLCLHRIMANYQPVNERSGTLLKRLGFTIEGYARDYLYLNGAWRDHILTALNNPGFNNKGLA